MAGRFRPAPTGPSHVFLEIHDSNSIAELYDYRRVVISVEGAAWQGGFKRPSAGQPNDARAPQ